MDTVLLFALPLVGGLIFCSHWNFTRWRVAREDGHRLYFRAVYFGVLIFAAVAFVHYHVESRFPQYSVTIKPVKDFIKPLAKEPSAALAVADLTVICFLAMLAGLPLAWLLNLVFWKKYWLRRAIRKDALEGFLLDAAESEDSIAVTMDDHKVYVGYLVESFDPTVGRKCIKILPLMSGYRDAVTHKLNFTTFYTQLYGHDGSTNKTAPLPAPLAHLTAEDFIIVLPAERIVSYRMFDAPAYHRFQQPRPEVLKPPAAATPSSAPAPATDVKPAPQPDSPTLPLRSNGR